MDVPKEKLKKYTLKNFIDWMGIDVEDFAFSDPETIELVKEIENDSLYSLSDSGWFHEYSLEIKEFLEEMESKKEAGVVTTYANPVTEILEDYVLDYKDNKYIIIESETNIENILNESEFIDYLIEKGENRFDAVDIANQLKEESKIANLIKVSESEYKLFLVYKDTVGYHSSFNTEKELAHFIFKVLPYNFSPTDYLTTVEWREKGLFINNVFYKIFWGFDYDDYDPAYLTINEKSRIDNYIVEFLREKSVVAALVKAAKPNDIAFDTKADLRIWVDLSDIEYDSEIQNIKKMDLPTEEKIKLAKERSLSLATDNLNRLWYRNNISVNQYTPPIETYDRIKWEELF